MASLLCVLYTKEIRPFARHALVALVAVVAKGAHHVSAI